MKAGSPQCRHALVLFLMSGIKLVYNDVRVQPNKSDNNFFSRLKRAESKLLCELLCALPQKPLGWGSIWILNIQWSRQCLKYTGRMGLPSDHRGSTVHYLLKLPINLPSHSHSVCVTLTYSPPVSFSDVVSISLSFFLIFSFLSVCIYLEYRTLFRGLFLIRPFCPLELSGALSALVSPFTRFFSLWL